MIYRWLADGVLLLHLAFILFVLFGALLVWRRRKVIWLHLPAVGWGVVVEVNGWFCPLTPLEVRFRVLAGDAGYDGSFVERYLLPIVYPSALTPTVQMVLGVGVLLLNAVLYGRLFWADARRKGGDASRE
ncbi:MAG: DUF2784 domain-containing protein [Gammaproteobacteria bacterium]|nr:MAG: DUF2784 domain-containing protein [Gammaproteobacteria bacterium]